MPCVSIIQGNLRSLRLSSFFIIPIPFKADNLRLKLMVDSDAYMWLTVGKRRAMLKQYFKEGGNPYGVQIERSVRHGEEDGQEIVFHKKEIRLHAGGATVRPPLFSRYPQAPAHSLFAANRVFPNCPV
jgi:hypothetical protein